MTKRKVLIPLDGSEFSRQILGVVQEYLSPQEVALTLLQVTTPDLLTADKSSYARDRKSVV